jgi:hypothetical protein
MAPLVMPSIINQNSIIKEEMVVTRSPKEENIAKKMALKP